MSAKSHPTVLIWLAADGWRWEYRSTNGSLQAMSCRAYTRRAECLAAFAQVQSGLAEAKMTIGKGPAKLPVADRTTG